MTFPMPFFAPQIDPVSLTFIGNHTDTSDASTYTFTGKSFGSAAGDRRVIVVVGSRVNTAGAVPTCTIGGVSATEVVRANNAGAGASTDITSIFIAHVPTGTTGDVVVGWNLTMLRCTIGIYRMTGAGDGVYENKTDITLSSSTLSTTINVPGNGACLASAWGNATSSTFTWTGLTEDFENNPETTSNGFSGAHANFTAAQSSLGVSVVINTTPSDSALAVASWGPA